MPRMTGDSITYKELTEGNYKLFQTVKEFCVTSGLSCKMIREGCKAGTIPHIRVGEGTNARFMINVWAFMKQLEEQGNRGLR